MKLFSVSDFLINNFLVFHYLEFKEILSETFVCTFLPVIDRINEKVFCRMCAVKSIIIMLLINKHINIVINNVVESMCEFSREHYSKATRFCFKKKK